MADVTTHTNIVRPDSMELLTTAQRLPERVERLERAASQGLLGGGGSGGDAAIVVDFAADTTSYVVSDLSKIAQDRVWEFIFEGTISVGTILAIRPNSVATAGEYMNRRHRHWQTDQAAAVGHDVTPASSSHQEGLLLGVAEWSTDNAIVSRATMQKTGRSNLGLVWLADWTTGSQNQFYVLRSSIVGKWWSASAVTSLQIICTAGTIRAGSRLVIKSAERGPAGPQGTTGPQGNTGAQGVKGDTGAVGPQGGIESYEQPGQPSSVTTGAIWIDTDEEPPTYVKPFLTPVVSVLPASPYDGQEVYFQTTAMETLGIVWHLRYRTNATGLYKWEFLGGLPYIQSGGSGLIPITTPAVTSLTWNVPLAGFYAVDFGASMVTGNTPGSYSELEVVFNNGSHLGYSIRANLSTYEVQMSMHQTREVLAAGNSIYIRAFSYQSSGSFNSGWLKILPMRVK